ncbi:hypothetical protein ACFS2C_27355 [Prauserella oleivorans]|uniref:PE domain-containing protein n=1 Tax=Prauserella oleivorans TaxID=1478153 RepID=A0ABW5WGY8_9PSEU
MKMAGDQIFDQPVSDSAGMAGGNWVNAGISAAAVAKTSTEAGKMLQVAKSGGFRVSERGAQPLIEALADARDRIDQMLGKSYTFSTAPPLGSSPYAVQVAEHVRKSGDGPQGAVTVLTQLQAVLEQSEEALRHAMRNYREAEDNATSHYKA